MCSNSNPLTPVDLGAPLTSTDPNGLASAAGGMTAGVSQYGGPELDLRYPWVLTSNFNAMAMSDGPNPNSISECSCTWVNTIPLGEHVNTKATVVAQACCYNPDDEDLSGGDPDEGDDGYPDSKDSPSKPDQKSYKSEEQKPYKSEGGKSPNMKDGSAPKYGNNPEDKDDVDYTNMQFPAQGVAVAAPVTPAGTTAPAVPAPTIPITTPKYTQQPMVYRPPHLTG